MRDHPEEGDIGAGTIHAQGVADSEVPVYSRPRSRLPFRQGVLRERTLYKGSHSIPSRAVRLQPGCPGPAHPIDHDEFCWLAHRYMPREHADHKLLTTALVNETNLPLVDAG